MSYNYWLDEVGFISRNNLKEIIHNPEFGFTGFRRFSDGYFGAFAFISHNRKILKLNILNPIK